MSVPFVFTKPFTWSYSRLKNYEACPKKHYHVDLVKDAKEPESQQLKDGNRIHEALARAIGTDDNMKRDPRDRIHQRPLPSDLQYLQPHVDRMRRFRDAGGVVCTEMSLAIDNQFQPCPWFDPRGGPPRVWYRCKVDAIGFDPSGRVAIAPDWKTGAVKDDFAQLAMTALVLFAQFPTLERVRTEFVWLAHDEITDETFNRADQAAIWNDIYPRVTTLHSAFTNRIYDPQPSGLCRKWCPVTQCPFYGKGSPR